MVTDGFHHIGLVGQDADHCIAFYHTLLGLDFRHHSDTLVFDDILSISIRPEARRGRWGVGGVHHVALGVSDEAQQLKWKRRLTDHGVPVSGPYDRGWFTSIYFSDPDGQILEIATAGPGYDVDESIETLGTTIAMPKPSQLRGQRDEAAIAAATHPEPVDAIDAGMRIDGIHHVTGITHDVERIGDFYTRALGLALVKRSVNQDDPRTPHLFWANYDGTRVAKHSTITQFGWPRSDYFARPGAGQAAYVAWRAGARDELKAWEEQLQATGSEALPVGRAADQLSLSFTAPDGLRMMLVPDQGTRSQLQPHR